MKRPGMTRKQRANQIATSQDIGVSFSLLACRDYGIDWRDTLHHTIELGFKRFRLMSYWKVIEKQKGVYDFKDLDEQIAIIKKSGGRVSLSIGMRQPRWPETHVPLWTKTLDVATTTQKYIAFHKAVIERYKHEECIESWQLENEFWLRSFGEHINFSRRRLMKEFTILRKLDPERPIIMTLARVVSLPLRRPTPDIYGTSMYRIIYNDDKKKYTHTWAKPWVYRLKSTLIKIIKNRNVIVHELQTEPWGPKANWELTVKEQNESMSRQNIQDAIVYARRSGISYIDMWGAEWWYWRQKTTNDDKIMTVVSQIVTDSHNSVS